MTSNNSNIDETVYQKKYSPLLFKFNDINLETLDINDSDVKISETPIFPLITLGFQHFLHRTRSNMIITKKSDINNEFYYIVNKFECKIPNYDKNIDIIANEYLDLYSKDINILKNNDIYKYWEILLMFNILNISNYKIIHSTNDSFVVAINNYCKLLEKKNCKESSKNVDIILADQKINIDIDDNFEEQKSYELIISEIIEALKYQGTDGTFILRLSDTFTMPSAKLIYILCGLYKEIYIYKPYFSRQSTAEKYVICKLYKYKNTDIIIKSLRESLEGCLKLMKDKYIYDIYSNLQLPIIFMNKLKFINIKITNIQQIIINEIIKYIKEYNYYGDKYHQFREQQIESTKWWINIFFSDMNMYQSVTKKDIDKLIEFSQDKYKSEFNKFISNLVI